ncbi:MAG: DUF4836 family protein [Bacteroidota bacterium]|nr:DUF4836 family protein [Bacteroidota bacterium]
MRPLFSAGVRQMTALLLLTTALVISSCSKKEYPDNLTFIPKESSLVACIDLKALAEKADMKELKKSATFKSLSQEVFSDQPALKAILDDPSKSGVKFKQVFMFLTGTKNVGVTLELDDASDFESMLKKLAEQAGIALDVKKESDCNYVTMPQNDSTLLVWDKHKALLVANTPKDQAIKIFTTPKESSIVMVKDFADAYKQKKDLFLWTKNDSASSSLGALLQLPVMAAETELMKGTFTHVNLEFKDGEVVCTSETTPLDLAKKLDARYISAHPDDNILRYFPKTAFLMGRVALKMPAIAQYLSTSKDNKAFANADNLRVINSLNGDVVFSVFNFANGVLPVPQLAVAATVKDKSLYDYILKQLPAMVQKKNTGAYLTLTLDPYVFYLAQKGNLLMVANSEDAIKSFAEGKPQPVSLLDASPVANIKGCPGVFYLNLDPDNYPQAIMSLLDTFGGGAGSKFKTMLFLKDLQGTYDPNTAQGKVVLRLKDNKKNSLAVILQKADELVAAR